MIACSQERTGSGAARFEDCMLGGPQGATRVQARCTTIDGLRVAVLAAEGGRRAPDPLFFIPGGPGQSGGEAFAQVAGAFAIVRRHRDVVVIDPRGTGLSDPLTCSASLPADLRSADALSRLRTCAAELGERPSRINTANAVRDIELVRGALGYEKINVYAASYGTRVALQLAREGSTRAMVLDGVIAPETSLGVAQSEATERAFSAMERRGGLALGGVVTQLASELARRAIEVGLTHPITGEPTTIEVDDRTLEDTLRFMLYQSELVALIPKLLEDAQRGNFVPLAARAVLMRASLEEAVNPLVYLSVVCAEDVPFLGPARSPRGLFEARVDELIEACTLWPVKAADGSLKAPVDTDIPMLLLSGSADPVTPPEEAAKVAAHAKRARSLVLKEQGHIGIVRGCMPRVVSDFLDAPADVDVSCTERMSVLPLFRSASGP